MLLEIPPQPGRITVALPNCANPPKIGHVVQVAGLGGYMVNATGHTLDDEPPDLLCGNMHVVKCPPPKKISCYSNKIKLPYSNRLCVQEPNIDTREGDSGGGVIYNNMIYGVISSGQDRACTGPAVTVNVCSYMTWINQEINPRSNGK
ncbi:granzyme F-like [Pundamilia nyererei]|uniref:Granzyme F-like n=1 Tax=Pundamilia nyererei TaxID=303518 RepID=A0A9Y3VZ94_9CICH|nr:PREDICTED: granzyme F-like [Pundamilia nyererei]